MGSVQQDQVNQVLDVRLLVVHCPLLRYETEHLIYPPSSLVSVIDGSNQNQKKKSLKNRFLTYFGGAGVVPIDSSRKIRPGHGVKIGF